MVLFSICTALKEDLHCTAAELVYGATLRLPTEFSNKSSGDDLNPVSYVAKLEETTQQLRPTPPYQLTWHKVHVSKDLAHGTHVFVCHNAHCTHLFMLHNAPQKALQPTHNGLYKAHVAY